MRKLINKLTIVGIGLVVLFLAIGLTLLCWMGALLKSRPEGILLIANSVIRVILKLITYFVHTYPKPPKPNFGKRRTCGAIKYEIPALVVSFTHLAELQ
jgi:hypothetical protein